MYSYPAVTITKNDIEQLIANQIPESRTLDYKETLPGSKDDDIKEFLADVSSFANTGGGRIYYGISDKRDSEGKSTGCPEQALGLDISNIDDEKRKIEQRIATAIAPRIAGVKLSSVDGFAKGPVFVLDIPQSWTRPHMVTFKGSSRFFNRNGTGKQQLDFLEIRAAFSAAESVPSRIRQFRDERLGRIIAGETPVLLEQAPWLALHIVPVASFANRNSIDIHTVNRTPSLIKPIKVSSYNFRYNLDGVCVWGSGGRSGTLSSGYSQIFRLGEIEFIDTNITTKINQHKHLIENYIEEILLKQINLFIKAFRALKIEAPVVVMISIAGIKNAFLSRLIESINEECIDLPGYVIDQDMILFPDIWLDDFDLDISKSLRPIFDALWQAGGMPGSENYNEEGEWSLKRSWFP